MIKLQALWGTFLFVFVSASISVEAQQNRVTRRLRSSLLTIPLDAAPIRSEAEDFAIGKETQTMTFDDLDWIRLLESSMSMSFSMSMPISSGLPLPTPSAAPIATPAPVADFEPSPPALPTATDAPIPSTTTTTSEPSLSPVTGEPTTEEPSPAPQEMPTTEEPSRAPQETPTTEEPSPAPQETPTTEEPSPAPQVTPTTEEPSPAPQAMPTTEEPTTPPSEEVEPSMPPQSELGDGASEPTASPVTDSPTVSPVTKEPSAVPVTDVPSLAPVTEEPSIAPVTDVPSLAPVTESPTMAPAVPLSAGDTISEQADTSILELALSEAGLLQTLQESEGPLTLFAPINGAFTDVDVDRYTGAGYGQHLSSLLLYHVNLDAAVMSGDLSDGQILGTASGFDLEVDIDDGVSFLTEASQNDRITTDIDAATVVEADVEVTNGVIHKIDEVLLPVWAFQNTAEVLQADGRFGTLLDLLGRANLTDTVTMLDGSTLFAPTNEAFGKFTQPQLDFLLDPANGDDLSRILSFHVATELYNPAESLGATTLSTAFTGRTLSLFSSAGGMPIVQGNIPVTDIALFQRGNIMTIDTVLLPLGN